MKLILANLIVKHTFRCRISYLIENILKCAIHKLPSFNSLEAAISANSDSGNAARIECILQHDILAGMSIRLKAAVQLTDWRTLT